MKVVKKVIVFSLCTFCALAFIYGQTLVKQWDKRYGGFNVEELHSFIQTNDGGYLLSGRTYSEQSGDITEPTRDTTFNHIGDWWIVKLDTLGNKEWDKRFGGGNDDRLYTAIQTHDGGFLLGGQSNSLAGGDKSQNSWLTDFWVVKINSTGNKEWDKTFGSSGSEQLYFVAESADGGYLLAGTAGCGIGGDKTEPCRDTSATGLGIDYWIIKVDSVGNKKWDKTYGGFKLDYLSVVQRTSDNGYILGGGSNSGIGGDKTEPNWDATTTTYDCWILKIDSAGNKQWDKRYGGTKEEGLVDLKQTADGGYILAGSSGSAVSGDKSQPAWGTTSYLVDYWIVKIDAAGLKQWDRRYGGVSIDRAETVMITADGGYLLGGASHSNVSGDKSENNMALIQSWVVKTDSLGNKQWDRTMFTSTITYFISSGRAIETQDGCYAVANYHGSDIGGYKTQDCWGDSSYNATNFWVIKFCIDTSTGIGEWNEEENVLLYPNPTYSRLSIQLSKAATINLTYQILSITGQVLLSSPLGGQGATQPNFEIDVSKLPAGLYFLQLQDDNKQRAVKKFIKH